MQGSGRNDDYTKFRRNATEIPESFWDTLNTSLDNYILVMKLEMLFVSVVVSIYFGKVTLHLNRSGTCLH